MPTKEVDHVCHDCDAVYVEVAKAVGEQAATVARPCQVSFRPADLVQG